VNEMGGARGTFGWEERVHTRFGGETWGKGHLKDLRVDGKILIFK
jgi:hypothetical protein